MESGIERLGLRLEVPVEAGHELRSISLIVAVCLGKGLGVAVAHRMGSGHIEPDRFGKLVLISGRDDRALEVKIALAGIFAVKVLSTQNHLVLTGHIIGTKEQAVARNAFFSEGRSIFLGIFNRLEPAAAKVCHGNAAARTVIFLPLSSRPDASLRCDAEPAADAMELRILDILTDELGLGRILIDSNLHAGNVTLRDIGKSRRNKEVFTLVAEHGSQSVIAVGVGLRVVRP